MSRPWNAREALIGAGVGLAGGLALFGVFMWYFGYLTGSAEAPFAFAQVTGTIGALLLVGWVVRAPDRRVTGSLARTGKLLILASLGFLALGMFSPSLKVEFGSGFAKWSVVSLNAFSLLLASISLAWAVMELVLRLPTLDLPPGKEPGE